MEKKKRKKKKEDDTYNIAVDILKGRFYYFCNINSPMFDILEFLTLNELFTLYPFCKRIIEKFFSIKLLYGYFTVYNIKMNEQFFINLIDRFSNIRRIFYITKEEDYIECRGWIDHSTLLIEKISTEISFIILKRHLDDFEKVEEINLPKLYFILSALICNILSVGSTPDLKNKLCIILRGVHKIDRSCIDFFLKHLFFHGCENGYAEVVKILLDDPRSGAKVVNPNVMNPNVMNNNAIQMASDNGHIEVVKLLLADKRVDPSDMKNYAIRFASENGHTDVVKLLLVHPKVDPSDENNYAIRKASKNGHIDVVKLLLTDKRSGAKAVDPSVGDNYAIRVASKNGHSDVVKLLLDDPRIDPSTDYNEAIKQASRNGHKEVVKLLLADKRVDPSVDKNYAIGYASENGHVEVVKLLLDDPRVDPSDDYNYAFKYASEYGHLDVVKLLLDDKRVNPSDAILL